MTRRVVATAALAATALLTSGALPLVGAAHADACAAWADPEGDAKPMEFENAPNTPALDIMGAAVETAGGDVVATVKVSDLASTYAGTGDLFQVSVTVSGVRMTFAAGRGEAGDFATLTSSVATAPATVQFDPAGNTVRMATTLAEFDKVAGKAAAGVAADSLNAATAMQVNGTEVVAHDYTQLVEGLTYVVGAACATPRTPVVIPQPAVDCTPNITDAADDGTPKGPGDVGTGNDASLDVRSVVFNSTPQHLMAYVTVAALADKPANYQGDRFEVGFKAGTKAYTFSAGRAGLGRSLNMPAPTRGTVDGAADEKLAVRGVFDQPKNTVVILIDRAALNTVNGSAVADGTTLTEVVVTTAGAQPGMYLTADRAEATAEADRVYKVGDNPCFGPPKSKLVNTGAVTTQFGDAAAVAAKLTTEAGEALAGKTVRFQLGAVSTTATTGSDGVAEATLASPLVAGAYNLVASFAGDASAKTSSLTTPFTIAQEKTKITLSVVKSGTKRTVTAKLVDDDGKVLAAQPVAWFINNKASGAPKTNSAGVVTLTTAKPTQTVKAVFTAVAGKYVGSTASVKV
ncbi:MAG TPA: hypothetical protein VNA20_08755 [Frankiaceae bacterium]|nr:hypothetical protein [Frankiaceae bacterium]